MKHGKYILRLRFNNQTLVLASAQHAKGERLNAGTYGGQARASGPDCHDNASREKRLGSKTGALFQKAKTLLGCGILAGLSLTACKPIEVVTPVPKEESIVEAPVDREASRIETAPVDVVQRNLLNTSEHRFTLIENHFVSSGAVTSGQTDQYSGLVQTFDHDLDASGTGTVVVTKTGSHDTGAAQCEVTYELTLVNNVATNFQRHCSTTCSNLYVEHRLNGTTQNVTVSCPNTDYAGETITVSIDTANSFNGNGLGLTQMTWTFGNGAKIVQKYAE